MKAKADKGFSFDEVILLPFYLGLRKADPKQSKRHTEGIANRPWKVALRLNGNLSFNTENIQENDESSDHSLNLGVGWLISIE